MSNYSIADQMVVSMARMLKNDETVFHGLSSPLPMVAILLAKKLHAPKLVYVNISGSVDPNPLKLPKSTVSYDLWKGTRSTFSLTDIFDLSARGKLDTAFLSGAQIDGKARINNSVIGSFDKPKVRLPGGAGSAVIIPTARQTIVWRTKHDKRTFVEQVDFVTSTGNVKYVVTPLCIFEKVNDQLVLRSIHSTSSLQEVTEHTGFPLLYDQLQVTPEPTREELIALRRLDPHHVRMIEF